MSGRDWLRGCLAGTAIAVLALPTSARAELRRFTSEPLDTNRSFLFVYAPVLMTKLGSTGGAEFPGTLAQWTQLALGGVPAGKEEATGGPIVSGPYRIIGFDELRDPNQPTTPPQVRVIIEQEGQLPEDSPPPMVSLVDSSTGLETRETAAVLREPDRTLYRVELSPPQAALVPEGHRVYLNPSDRYTVELLGGVRERVAGMRQTLPTFGGSDWRTRSTRRRREH